MDNYNYAVIGNCTISALISDKGSIDWLCMPEMDSYSVFAKILDDIKGGSFEIEVDDSYHITQQYIPHTNIVETIFSSEEDEFHLIDFSPRYKNELDTSYHCPPEITRLLIIKRGKPKIKVKYQPKLNYAKSHTHSMYGPEYIKSQITKKVYESVYLYTSIPFATILEGTEIELTSNHFFLLTYHEKIINPTWHNVYIAYEKTKTYWTEWIKSSPLFEKYQKLVERSTLVLKLMASQKSGAVLAALTTSLPETIGGNRTWDYRFCWIRDASMTISVLSDVGHTNTVRQYIQYILNLISTKNEKMQIMYGIRGKKKLREEVLSHLSGYEGSKPVRIGNAAYKQKQNDIYGVLMDVLYKSLHFFTYSSQELAEVWTIVRTLVRNVFHNWKKPDRGIWEFRGKEEHFVFSKVLCWVAMDRAIKIAIQLEKSHYAFQWAKIRDTIHADVMKKGWNEKLQAFSQYYGSESLDSANLLMQDYGFISPTHPKFVATVERSIEQLSENGLMYRYKTEDDFGQPESAFFVCSFWLVECLYKIGRKEEAKERFDTLVSYANHVGLLSEDIDFISKRLLGNFPQAYTHLALISAVEVLCEREHTV